MGLQDTPCRYWRPTGSPTRRTSWTTSVHTATTARRRSRCRSNGSSTTRPLPGPPLHLDEEDLDGRGGSVDLGARGAGHHRSRGRGVPDVLPQIIARPGARVSSRSSSPSFRVSMRCGSRRPVRSRSSPREVRRDGRRSRARRRYRGTLVFDGGHVALIDVDQGVNATAERLRAEHPGSLALAVRCDVSDQADVASPWARSRRTLRNRSAGEQRRNRRTVDHRHGHLPRGVSSRAGRQPHRHVPHGRAGAVMAEGGGGCIVNIGSILGQQGTANGAAYCASKGGVALFTHSLALEVAHLGIRVNTIAGQHADGDASGRPARAGCRPRHARRGGSRCRPRDGSPRSARTGDDVAGAVAWLASPDASYVTG